MNQKRRLYLVVNKNTVTALYHDYVYREYTLVNNDFNAVISSIKKDFTPTPVSIGVSLYGQPLNLGQYPLTDTLKSTNQKEVLESEFEDKLKINLDDMYYGIADVGSGYESKKYIMLYYAPRDFINDLIQSFEQNGFEIIYILPLPLIILRFIKQSRYFRSLTLPLPLFFIYKNIMTFILVQKDEILLRQNVIDKNNVFKNVYDYVFAIPGSVKRFILLGDNDFIQKLKMKFLDHKQFCIEELPEVMQNVSTLLYNVLCSMKRVGKDLYPEQTRLIKTEKKRLSHSLVLSITAIILVFLISRMYITGYREDINRIEEEISRSNAVYVEKLKKIEELKTVDSRVQDIIRRFFSIYNPLSVTPDWGSLLESLSDLVPEQIAFKELNINSKPGDTVQDKDQFSYMKLLKDSAGKNQAIILEKELATGHRFEVIGSSTSYAGITEFMKNLENSQQFSNVELKGAEYHEGEIMFQIQFVMK
ncbi:MAG: PilN domain-containing protein [Candidatus Hydrogenedentota bacterium]